MLSHRLDIMVIEDTRTIGGHGSLRVWEANCEILDGILEWHELIVKKPSTA
jgi:hypothetical protein